MIDVEELKKFIAVVHEYIKIRLNQEFDKNELIEICAGINSILLDWTGNTYVGRKKEICEEKQYQYFFVLIHEFLKFCCSNSDDFSEMERTLAEFVMFRGTVYRYLGKSDSRNCQKKIRVEPEYNEVFVSWSKTERNAYIESKLYGPRTWMKAEIEAPDFGIDIHGFELWCQKWLGRSYFITRGNEKEVVFPTYERCIVQKIYL